MADETTQGTGMDRRAFMKAFGVGVAHLATRNLPPIEESESHKSDEEETNAKSREEIIENFVDHIINGNSDPDSYTEHVRDFGSLLPDLVANSQITYCAFYDQEYALIISRNVLDEDDIQVPLPGRYEGKINDPKSSIQPGNYHLEIDNDPNNPLLKEVMKEREPDKLTDSSFVFTNVSPALLFNALDQIPNEQRNNILGKYNFDRTSRVSLKTTIATMSPLSKNLQQQFSSKMLPVYKSIYGTDQFAPIEISAKVEISLGGGMFLHKEVVQAVGRNGERVIMTLEGDTLEVTSGNPEEYHPPSAHPVSLSNQETSPNLQKIIAYPQDEVKAGIISFSLLLATEENKGMEV